MKYNKIKFLLEVALNRFFNLYYNNPALRPVLKDIPKTADGKLCFGEDWELANWALKILEATDIPTATQIVDPEVEGYLNLINPNLISEIRTLFELIKDRIDLPSVP